ncbi:MAG TPA: glycosyltransferase family 39 protein [Chloroflexota bacterium]|nr:glycosyltransferase family 39 protein [Chloroflexota bacterium]
MALALALRLWALGENPPGLDSDEASIGYNAYAIARTGRDEHGSVLPLAFEAFGEFKRPAYIYAAAPFVGLLGLSPFSVRLPAALFGALSVLAIYRVALRLLANRRQALIAAGLLAISPWHLQFTRAAREVSLLVLALLVMVCCLLEVLTRVDAPGRGVVSVPVARRQTRWLAGGAAAFLVAVYAYPGALALAPLLALAVLLAYSPAVRSLERGAALVACLVLVGGALPLVVQVADGRARTRLDQASLLNDPALRERSEARVARERAAGGLGLLQGQLASVAGEAVAGYLAHFDPSYLFTRGDAEPRHRSSDVAHLYLWDAPLVLAGLYTLVRRRHAAPMRALGGWLVVAPLPAALAQNAPHAVRSIGLLPAFTLLAAAGAPPLWRWLRTHHFHKDWLLLLALSVGFYLYGFHRLYPLEHGRAWNAGMLEGYRAAAALADEPSDPFRRVVIPEEMGLSYVYALFGTKYDPAAYLKQGGTHTESVGDGVLVRMTFEPFEVRHVDWRTEPRDPAVLYVLDGPAHAPAGTEQIHVARGPNAEPILQLIRFSAGRA